MFVPSRKRWAYFPRTPPLKSYSGRMSSPELEGLLVFFIGLALTARGRSGVDNANLVTPFCMRNYYETPRQTLSDKEPPLLADRVVWIRDCDREGIAKRRGGLVKVDPVLTEVRGRLLTIPKRSAASGQCRPRSLVAHLPNGSRLSCARPARRRKSSG